LGSQNNTPDETNGVNNAVSGYKEALQFSVSFVIIIINVIYMAQIHICAASAPCRLLHVYVVRNVCRRFRNTDSDTACQFLTNLWNDNGFCIFITSVTLKLRIHHLTGQLH